MKAISIILLVIALVFLVPYVFLWALNVLFHLGFAYTFKNWLAAFVITMIFGTNRK